MKLPALLTLALFSTASFVVIVAPASAAQVDICREKDIGVGQIQVLHENPCTEGTAFACLPKNHQGDWKCTPVGLWCWCPGPVIG